MEQSPIVNEITLYYQELQNHLSDIRNDKGKRHELALILTTVLLGILRSVGKLKVSVIHHQKRREHEGILSILGLKMRKFISDSQFRRVLNSIDYQSYNALNDCYFGHLIVETSGEWKAVNGKELRGNIDRLSGQRRSENVVKMVSYEDKNSQILGFYNGRKESEKTIHCSRLFS
jgi:hypothetical protein